MLSRFLVSFTDRLVVFGSANKIDIVLTAFQKIGKNTRGRLELLTSIYFSSKILYFLLKVACFFLKNM